MPNYPHRIRLRGPWECTAPGSAASRRVTVPCRLTDVGLPAFSRHACLSRKFGYPGQIDSFERVWLTVADIHGKATISLNEFLLGTATGPCEFEVTSLLKPHNRLDVALSARDDGSGLLGEVALVVRCAVFLRNLHVHCAEGAFVVAGELFGSWTEPFDLYFFLDDIQIDYQSLQTSGDKTPFRAMLKPTDDAPFPTRLRVDLVQGPSLWSSEIVSLE